MLKGTTIFILGFLKSFLIHLLASTFHLETIIYRAAREMFKTYESENITALIKQSNRTFQWFPITLRIISKSLTRPALIWSHLPSLLPNHVFPLHWLALFMCLSWFPLSRKLSVLTNPCLAYFLTSFKTQFKCHLFKDAFHKSLYTTF